MHTDGLQNAPLTTLTAIAGGDWLAGRAPFRGKARRVHFYPGGEELAICMRSLRRPPRALRFDPTSRLTEYDPKLDGPQHRTACALCTILLADDPDAVDLTVAPLPDGELSFSLDLNPDLAYPIRVTRAMGTRDDVARFAVVPGVTSGRRLNYLVPLFTATAVTVKFELVT